MNKEGLNDPRTLPIISFILYMHERTEGGQTGHQGWGWDRTLLGALGAPQHRPAWLSLRAGLKTRLWGSRSLSAPSRSRSAALWASHPGSRGLPLQPSPGLPGPREPRKASPGKPPQVRAWGGVQGGGWEDALPTPCWALNHPRLGSGLRNWLRLHGRAVSVTESGACPRWGPVVWDRG